MEAPDGTGRAGSSRHKCRHLGCEKTFIRKEHLTRHEKSHAPQRSFVCYVCQHGFTRNDILQRHIVRHNNSARATARNGRACDGCHSSKIKCEGGQPCLPCVKRRLECSFERDEVTVVRESLSNSAINNDDVGNDLIPSFSKEVQPMENHHVESSSSRDPNSHHNIENNHNRDEDYDAPLVSPEIRSRMPTFDQLGFEVQDPLHNGAPNMIGSTNTDSHNLESVTISNGRTLGPWGAIPSNTPFRSMPESVTEDRYKLYLDYFHHRWPIIHIPSLEKGDKPYILTASVEMIGAWLQNSPESQTEALTLHDRLANHVLQRMYQKPSYADRYMPWPMSLYQATLLNIIFAFYSGDETLLYRVGLLRSMLISNLRELGFFRSEIATLQEKGCTFYPYIMGEQESRKRLAIALFKIDCYFSISRGEPMTVRCEELYFSLPATFSVTNAPGLHVWEARLPDEPMQRSLETVSSMISDRSFSSIMQPFIMLEDIQLGICASQTSLWHYSEEIQTSLEHDINSLVRQKSQRDCLKSWKRLFDQTAIGDSGQPTQGKTNIIPMKYYYGVESHAEDGWQDIVLNRPQSLQFDTAMLYHLFGLHLHANVRSFENLAFSTRDFRSISTGDHKDDKFSEERARKWTTVVCSRQAIWHACTILNTYRLRPRQYADRTQLLDPICFVAIAVGSLVIWAYCYYNPRSCARCIGSTDFAVDVNLLDILSNDEQSERWIELGGLAMLDGYVLCRCNVENLVQVFRRCLPSGTQRWAFVESLSPPLKDLFGQAPPLLDT